MRKVIHNFSLDPKRFPMSSDPPTLFETIYLMSNDFSLNWLVVVISQIIPIQKSYNRYKDISKKLVPTPIYVICWVDGWWDDCLNNVASDVSSLIFFVIYCKILWKNLFNLSFFLQLRGNYTANVCRDLWGVYREIGVRGFQIYGDCM